MGLFIPYSRTTDMIIAGAGVLLFSAYIVYDTHVLFNRRKSSPLDVPLDGLMSRGVGLAEKGARRSIDSVG